MTIPPPDEVTYRWVDGPTISLDPGDTTVLTPAQQYLVAEAMAAAYYATRAVYLPIPVILSPAP